jgi:hypothetical protein
MRRTANLLAAILMSGFFTSAVSVAAQIEEETGSPLNIPRLEPLRPGVSAEQVFAAMLAHNELRTAALVDYTVLRTYEISDPKGRMRAQEVGRMEFRAPDRKAFSVTSEKGSGLIRRLALNPLIASEVEAATGKQRRNSSITPANYGLELVGEQQIGYSRCFVARAIPNRTDKYLFDGMVWIDDQDYAIVRIEGHPAKKLSFWIEQADFTREYQKIDQFWLPRRDETVARVRLYGRKVLTIEHQNYTLNETLKKVAIMEAAKGR